MSPSRRSSISFVRGCWRTKESFCQSKKFENYRNYDYFQIQNLDPAIMEEFRCEFRIGETKHEKPALRSGEDTVVCGEMRFDQAGGDGLLPVAFDVVWMSSEAPKAHVIDNTQKVAVEVSIYYEFFILLLLLLLLHYQNNSKIYIYISSKW